MAAFRYTSKIRARGSDAVVWVAGSFHTRYEAEHAAEVQLASAGWRLTQGDRERMYWVDVTEEMLAECWCGVTGPTPHRGGVRGHF